MKTTTRSLGSNAGFSLLELLMAMTVFAVGLPAFVEAGAFASRIQARAEATLLSAELAQTALTRLSLLDPADPALVDVNTNNSKCFTVSGSCPADHGGDLNILNRIFGTWGAAASGESPYLVAVEDGVAAVWYEGYWFHVAWNVENNEPYNGMKTIDIFVVQKPFDGGMGTSFSRVTHLNLVRMMTAL